MKTIVERVIELLGEKGIMPLKKIYAELPEFSKSGIRGNIYRYIENSDNPIIQRVSKGVYSVVNVISVSKDKKTNENIVDFSATYYSETEEVTVFHKSFRTLEPVSVGHVQNSFNFDTLQDMLNDIDSVRAILQKGDVKDILKRIPSNSFNLLCCDPPYKTISGGNAKKKGQPSGMLSKNDGKIFKHNDIQISEWLPECYRLLKEGSHAYIFSNFLNLEEFMSECRKVGFKIHNLLVWQKQNCTPNRWYMKNNEYVIFARKGKAKAINNAGSKTVHQFDNIIGSKIHETEKPVDLLKMYIENSSNKGDWVLDPFAGSGSTAAAALLSGRKAYTIEIDDTYIPKIKDRLNSIIPICT